MLIAFQLCRALLLQRLLALCAPDGSARTALSPGPGALNARCLGCTSRQKTVGTNPPTHKTAGTNPPSSPARGAPSLAALCGSAPFTFRKAERDFGWCGRSRENQRAFQKQLFGKADLI